MCTINQDHMMYGSWDMKCNRQNFFVILGHFLPFYPPLTAQKMKISKMKKHLEISSFYTSVLKIMIIGYTVPEIWNVTDVIAIFILSYTIPFCPPTAQKLKISKQWKKDLQISSFYTLVPKIIIICYTISEIWHVSDVIIFILGNFLPFYPPNSPKNEISKHWKHILEISSFYTSVLKSWSYAILFLRYGAWQM